MRNNFSFNFEISDISMVVYNLNPAIRSTLFNYNRFVHHLSIHKFLKEHNSIKCRSNKRKNPFVNNHYTAWKVSRYDFFLVLIFPCFWIEYRDLLLKSLIQSKYRKIWTRINSTFGHFHVVLRSYYCRRP